ncbi:MAG: branched-chain amino acid ABC transporter permease [Armatimonadota bacterium]|nr:branched-chain amino acid ABC transporter permease [Armatimonadota bacterium]MDR7470994.1 branched-chain amino acid ABC transporter permease [Armatimonadota bacterium]MDR7475743.1 branched-chain amino acid ABC transporter permease [Armatimonadota bacterium]MDR7538269.1 branched-chain amino acid ABC transporter permease [Armatimonadota bacterium]
MTTTDAATFLQYAVNGLFLSGLYALVALGLTLIFGVMHVADFAQGALYMLGAYVSFFFTRLVGSYFLSIPLAMLLIAGLGVLNDAVVYRPLHRHGGATTFIAALGILLILQNAALWAFGGDFRLIHSPFGDAKLEISGVIVTYHQLFVMVATAILIGSVWIFLRHTKPGKALRATAQNPEAARLVGISGERIALLAFAVAGSLAGAAGALVSPMRAFDPHIGAVVILKSFAIVIFGGMGSVPGAIVGALIIGLAETFTAAYLAAEFADLVAFALMILILFLRPQGLLGRPAAT